MATNSSKLLLKRHFHVCGALTILSSFFETSLKTSSTRHNPMYSSLVSSPLSQTVAPLYATVICQTPVHQLNYHR